MVYAFSLYEAQKTLIKFYYLWCKDPFIDSETVFFTCHVLDRFSPSCKYLTALFVNIDLNSLKLNSLTPTLKCMSYQIETENELKIKIKYNKIINS